MTHHCAHDPSPTWRLPDGYTIAQLIYTVHHAHTNPGALYRTHAGTTLTSPEYLRWFRLCLARKINRLLPPRGRKAGSDGYLSDWEREALHTAQAVNTPRRIVGESEIPMEFRARLRHRLTSPDDL